MHAAFFKIYDQCKGWKHTSSDVDFTTFFKEIVLKLRLTGLQLSSIVQCKSILNKSFQFEYNF